MDSRYKTIFSGRNDSQSSSLANFGKASFLGSTNFPTSGAQTNNGFQSANDNDAAMKFFEGSAGPASGNSLPNNTGRGFDGIASTLLKTQRTVDQGFQKEQRSLQNYQENQNLPGSQIMDTGRQSWSKNNLQPDGIDYDRVSIKPHNPFVNHTNSSHLFAIKAQISRDLANTHRSVDNYPSAGQTSAALDTNPYRIQSRVSSINNPLAASSRFSNPQLTKIYGNDFGSSPGITDRNHSTYSPDLERLTILPEANPTSEKLDKAKKFQNELELRKELILQIEERKKREEEAKRKNKLEEALEEEKIRKEIREFERVYGVKYEGLESRNLNLSLASELERAKALAKKKDLFASLDTLRPAARKPSNKRPRTPIEEVERILKLEKPDLKKIENSQQLLQKIPYAIKKQIDELVDDGLRPFRGEIHDEQENLSLQVAALRKQARLAEQERLDRQKELETLRLKLKQNQVMEHKKQTAVYTELIKNHKDPSSIYSTATTIDPDVLEEIYSLSKKLKRKGYWNNIGKKREQEIDNQIRSSSHLFSLSQRGKILKPEELEYGYLNAGDNETHAKYSEYAPIRRQGRSEDNFGDYDMIPSQLQDDEIMSDAVNLLRKNKDRLKLLDEIENPDINKLGQIIDSVEFGNDLRYQNERKRDEGLEGLRHRYISDYSDSLIEKISSVGFYS